METSQLFLSSFFSNKAKISQESIPRVDCTRTPGSFRCANTADIANGTQRLNICCLATGPPDDHSLCAVSVQPCQTEGSNLSPTPICCLEPHCFCVRCPSSANVNEPRRVIPQLIMLSAASTPGAALQSTAVHAGGSFPGVQRLM